MKKNHLVIVLLIIVSLLFIYSLINRIPDIDDSWDADYAFWQAKLGYAKGELMHGRGMQEIRLICHHKLLTLQGGLVINLFGFSLYYLKAISLLYFGLFLVIFYKYAYRKLFTPFYFYLLSLLFISNYLIFNFAFVFRPELTLMAFGFISYILLEKALKQDKNFGLLIVSGLFAGLCVATHLNGLMFVFAGGLLLLVNKRYVQSFIFGFSAIPTAAIYFYDFTRTYNFKFWAYQVKELAAVDELSNVPAGLSNLLNLFNEHFRYFHSPVEISFSLLFIVALVLAYKNLKTQRNLVIYSMVLVVTLGLISVSKSSKYAISYLPYLFILLISSISYIYEKKQQGSIRFQKFSSQLITILIVLYLSVNLFYNVRLSSRKFHSSFTRGIVTSNIHENTDSLRVVAPMYLVFNEILHFKTFQSEACFGYMQKNNQFLKKQGFLDLTKKYEADYLILTEEFYTKFELNNYTSSDFKLQGFDLILKKDKLLILKNIERYNQRHKITQPTVI